MYENTSRHYYELDSATLDSGWQPALLIESGMRAGIDPHRLLRGTRLFHPQCLQPGARISPMQFYQLIENTQRFLNSPDTAFLLGQQWLPGQYGNISHHLCAVNHLQESLERLIALRGALSPLVTPMMILDQHSLYLFFLESCNRSRHWSFLVESTMTSIFALSRQLHGEKLPWRFRFSYDQPAHIEQYWVHLGHSLQFGQKVDCMQLPREWATQSLSNGTKHEDLISAEPPVGILDHLFHRLTEHLHQGTPKQEQIAEELGMSTAGLKRLLKKHNTHFQQQLDQARLIYALNLMQIHNLSNEEVAERLQIHDNANFRRSFKRWTGMAPNQFRDLWI